MSKSCNKFIRDSLEIARQLTILADTGEQESQDDGCAVLYGVIRDCAYKIRGRAEREREVHRAMGIWTDSDTPRSKPGVKEDRTDDFVKKTLSHISAS